MPDQEERPNILVIITDQFHPRCTGYSGHPVVQTPNIDRLSQEGMTFRRMYSNQPLCMPARATLFTGRTPRGHGVRMNGIPLDPAIPTAVEAIRKSGYHTHCSGKIHLSCGGSTAGIHGGNAAGATQQAPELYPESRKLWESGAITQVPLPYYGLESVDYLGGCAYGTYGPYVDWLGNEHPDHFHLFEDKVALEPPSAAAELFNRNSFKWALPADLHPAAWVTDRAIDYLNRVHGDSRPFFLMCSIQEPHPPFAPPAEYAHMYDPSTVPPAAGREGEYDLLPPHFKRMYEAPLVTSGNNGQPMSATTPHRNECAAHYYGLISLVDRQVGRLLTALEENSLQSNTVVIFLADHGEALGDHGMWGKGPYHFDGVIRVPFIIRWPGAVEPGSVWDDPASLLDFAPTVLDMAKTKMPDEPSVEAKNAPSSLPGTSLVPILLGTPAGAEDAHDCTALVEMDEDYLGFKMRTLVTRRYRITCYSGRSYGELFDLEADPDECWNRWDDPAYRAIRDELRIKLLDKIMRTDVSVPRQSSRA